MTRLMRRAASLVAVFWAVSALAQEPPPEPFPGRLRDGSIVMLGVRDVFEGKTVKGVPYSARTETEIVQTLADGNRIVNRTTGFIARDGEGRTRREQALAAIGGLVVGPQAPRIVAIRDPVEHVTYLLDERTRTAKKLRDPAEGQSDVPRPDLGSPPGEAPKASGHVEEEPLGTRMIEGLTAEGTRRTVTLPEGAVGNERPIQIVSERWYSPEVQAQIATSRRDPRFGESRYRLTGVDRREPDKALFEVPRDYAIQEGPLRGSDPFGPRQPKRK